MRYCWSFLSKNDKFAIVFGVYMRNGDFRASKMTTFALKKNLTKILKETFVSFLVVS